MKKRFPIITVVIATFNSDKTLPLVLDSIRLQTYPQDCIEILIVDGGSHDATFTIAKKYNCKIINNPRTEPVHAKFLGYIKAKGDYIIYLDHDEVIENNASIMKKYSVIQNVSRIHAVIGSGYKNPKNYSFINNYINEFGDPFSFFIYRLSKDANFFIKQMRKRYPLVAEDKEGMIFDFSHVSLLPIIELCAAGSMIDAAFIKKHFPETLKDQKLIPHFFYLLHKKSLIAITVNDALVHYSSDTYARYLNKIRWRVKNNIYHISDIGQAGFHGREQYQPKYIRFRKYLYIPYAFSLVFLFIDACMLAITRKNINYFIHIPLTLFTAGLILYHVIRKSSGYNPQLRSYDETTLIKKHE